MSVVRNKQSGKEKSKTGVMSYDKDNKHVRCSMAHEEIQIFLLEWHSTHCFRFFFPARLKDAFTNINDNNISAGTKSCARQTTKKI